MLYVGRYMLCSLYCSLAYMYLIYYVSGVRSTYQRVVTSEAKNIVVFISQNVSQSAFQKQNFQNLKKRPGCLEKYIFSNGEIFAANAHRSYFMSFAYFSFISCT